MSNQNNQNRSGFTQHNNKAGFTLIELLVSIFVFSIVVIMVDMIYISAIYWERKVVASEKIQGNSILVTETMAREIRVSAISGPDAPNCSATSLNIIHPIYGEITYSLSPNGNVLRQTASLVNVSSSEVKFTRMAFCIVGTSPNDDLSSKVTVLLTLENRTGNQITPVSLQTTITSRDIDNEF